MAARRSERSSYELEIRSHRQPCRASQWAPMLDMDSVEIWRFQLPTNIVPTFCSPTIARDSSPICPIRFHQRVTTPKTLASLNFDDDGDLDVVIVSEDDWQKEFLINEGQGNFSDASGNPPVDRISNAAEVVDINSDGLRDIMIGNFGQNRLMK